MQILPTTLFGQKFVSLVRPQGAAARPLRDGDVIPSDRVETNVEPEPGAGRPVPAAARGASPGPQPHAQRAGHRARRPR
ncbi:hypothetical protein G5V59_05455 [Nocardioides sp. W3-2-3]|uniref:hypothetical protein n=1 Tax=Nocardioides convexus TaxID=2712224 RepID=UPI002418A73A|nr:hypothetical protein [Nocardioides convexus]NGZ99889.1 hypothetical protein [Nocardioides convexus]